MIDFLICNYNSGKDLYKCISSLKRGLGENCNIYVFDNNSRDDSILFLKEANFSKVVIIENDSNIGYGKAINKLTTLSFSEYLFILNPDAEILFTFDELKRQFAILESTIVGFNIVNQDGSSQNFLPIIPGLSWVVGSLIRILMPNFSRRFYDLYFQYKKTLVEKTAKSEQLISGCALFLKRETFNRVGGFNESYFLYFEDTEFLINAVKFKYKLLKSKLQVRHRASSSFDTSEAKIKVEKYKSAIIFFRNNNSMASSLVCRFLIFFFSIIGLFKSLITKDNRRYFTELFLLSFKSINKAH